MKAAILRLGEFDQKHPLIGLCRKFVGGGVEAGKEVTSLLQRDANVQLPEDVAIPCIRSILDAPDFDLPAQDQIISTLVRRSPAVRKFFATELNDSVTRVFNNIYDRGDASTNCLDTVVLDKSIWSSDDDRKRCETDLLHLFIAKLMESGHDHDGRALKGIARLLAVDAEMLSPNIDEEGFDVIISSLDNRLPVDVRSQATLAAAKFLEASQEAGQTYLANYITGKVQRQKSEDLIVAFSVAAAVFPIVPSAVSALFLTEGFLSSLIPRLEVKRSGSVDLAVLEMLNAACIDKNCREAVEKHCSAWLSERVSHSSSGERSSLAAVILAKVKAVPATQKPSTSQPVEEDDDSHSVGDLVDIFKGLMSKRIEGSKQNPIEGLAYASVQAQIKEDLASDAPFLKNLIRVIGENMESSSIMFGGLTVLCNLTRFQPNLSEEQRKMSQLKAYANTSKMAEPDVLDNDEHVLERCDHVIDAGSVPLLVECCKSGSIAVRDLVAQILLSLSRCSKRRGNLAQQGAVRLLLSEVFLQSNAKTTTNRVAAHALARILISVNPVHVFSSSGFPQASSAVRPLVSLLTAADDAPPDQPRDLLPIFESLLALTNLASYPDGSATHLILRLAWDTLEDLLLSNNTMIQRASCELVCNLMTVEEGAMKFADGTPRAGQRMHILLALADVEDIATRRAAGGALAMLTELETAAKAVIDRTRGVEILLGLCSEDSDELVHRGIVCVRNVVCAEGETGRRGQRAVKDAGGVETLKGVLKRTSNPVVLQTGVEALKPLMQD